MDIANVQTGSTRNANANLMASYDILAQPVMRLDVKKSFRTYKWLLNGSQQDQLRIHDATGVSAKLLHILYQITYLTTNFSVVRVTLTLYRRPLTFQESSMPCDSASGTQDQSEAPQDAAVV